jgi:IS30 family transposase
LGRAAGESVRSIAARLGRSPSTVSRELRRNVDGQSRYRATTAHALAYGRAARPKPAKLATNLVLRAKVEKDLERKYSPEQITGRLRVQFPDDLEMQVSPETIYQSLYVQSRGALRRDLAVCLRMGRALRRGTLENTNGLLRQYFPKGTDLGVHSSEDLDWVAQELNDRPRKRLAFMKPIELIGDLLLQ